VETVQTKHDMASVRANQLKYDLAVALFDEVYEQRRKLLGKNHPDTLSTLHELASALDDDGKKKEAGKIYRKVYKARMEAFGEDAAETLETGHELASNLDDQDKSTEALELYTKVWEGRKKTLGAEDPAQVGIYLSWSLELKEMLIIVFFVCFLGHLRHDMSWQGFFTDLGNTGKR
jgi:tetratricopeptide (TPR) repeat protein